MCGVVVSFSLRLSRAGGCVGGTPRHVCSAPWASPTPARPPTPAPPHGACGGRVHRVRLRFVHRVPEARARSARRALSAPHTVPATAHHEKLDHHAPRKGGHSPERARARGFGLGKTSGAPLPYQNQGSPTLVCSTRTQQRSCAACGEKCARQGSRLAPATPRGPRVASRVGPHAPARRSPRARAARVVARR